MTITTEPIVSVRDACCVLGGKRVLNEINLDVERGQVVVLIGPSGAGKTTLLRSINHLEELSSGEVLVGGVSIAHGAQARRSAPPSSPAGDVRSASSSSTSTCFRT